MSRSTRIRMLAAVAVLTVVTWGAPSPAGGQALYGSIVGIVTDVQGAVTPGVTVTATNTGTGLAVKAVTDTLGAYAIRNLLPGTYNLTATLSGFRSHEQKGI